MEEIFLKTIVEEFTKSFVSGSISALKIAKDEIGHFIDNGLIPYLDKQKNKYSYVKTFLHRTVPVYLYRVYYPLKLKIQDEIIETDSIRDVFRRSQFITVLGGVGSGKSTLVKHLFLNSIKEKLCIPILIELRYLNDYEKTIEDFIKEKLFENRLSPNDRILERLLTKGKFVFFLDGYDEIKPSVREKVVSSLTTFIGKYTENRFLLTSRPHSNIELLPLFHNCEIQKLSGLDIEKFVFRQIENSTLAKKIVESLNSSKSEYLRSFLTNPLLLALYILTFQTNSVIPNKKYIFYRRVLDVLFSEHDSLSKVGFERERKTNLSQDQIESLLKKFSFVTYFEGVFDFEKDYLISTLNRVKQKSLEVEFENAELAEDLKVSISLWIEDGNLISFAHRSIQEYFAALYVKDLNEENKIKIYNEKIPNILFKKHEEQEAENFLSFCREMDEFYFYKYLLLPTLNYLKSQIDNSSITAKLRSVISFFNAGLKIYYEALPDSASTFVVRNASYSGSNNMFKYSFAIDDLLEIMRFKVFDTLRKDPILTYLIERGFHDKADWKEPFDVNKLENVKIISLDYQKSLTTELLELMATTKILEGVNQIIQNINSSEINIREMLALHGKEDKELINLL